MQSDDEGTSQGNTALPQAKLEEECGGVDAVCAEGLECVRETSTSYGTCQETSLRYEAQFKETLMYVLTPLSH